LLCPPLENKVISTNFNIREKGSINQGILLAKRGLTGSLLRWEKIVGYSKGIGLWAGLKKRSLEDHGSPDFYSMRAAGG
jgi:hypothetical protein